MAIALPYAARARIPLGRFGDPTDPDTAALQRWFDMMNKRNVVITFGGGVNEIQRELIALMGLQLPRVPR